MHNTSESPKGVDECSSSLALILQPANDVPKKYLLSGKAAAGILRRANRRGKVLPERLQKALEQVAMLSLSETEKENQAVEKDL